MPLTPRRFVDQAALTKEIAELEVSLRPNVVRIRYTVGADWIGDPAIFFRIVLTDAASKPARLHSVTTRIRKAIEERIDPLGRWGLLPYERFRSLSETKELKEPAWA